MTGKPYDKKTPLVEQLRKLAEKQGLTPEQEDEWHHLIKTAHFVGTIKKDK
jgi:hypothetical protein